VTIKMPVLISTENDVYVTECPITNISTFGDTQEEAINNHIEAMELYIEDLSSADIKELENSSALTTMSSVKIPTNRLKS